MVTRERTPLRRFLLPTGNPCGWILFAAFTAALPLLASPEEANEDCLVCHEDDELVLDFEDGTELSLFVDAEIFRDSLHGEDLYCVDCHSGYDGDEHPAGEIFSDRRSYVLRSRDVCKTCHFETYTRTLESVHYELQQDGVETSPVCSDCHGAHDIQDPREKDWMMSRSCRQCHPAAYATYQESVHGTALSENGHDLPACADCHTAHQIEHPRDVKFHLASPALCLRCHGDEAMMERHDLATTIGSTFLTDFHGVTASLADPEEVEAEDVVVVCVDCHGYHNIASPEAVGAAAMQAHVQTVCQECHEGVSEDFPAAWLSHYPPSLENAPLVFLIKLLYRFFIPFMVVGLGLQVVLHLYRVGIRR